MTSVNIFPPRAATLLGGALLVLAGCEATQQAGTDPASPYMAELPEAVIELADPRQDLTRVTINPEDGCFWYLYDGPVETTLLPLRTRDGRAICTARKKEAEAEAPKEA